MPRRVPVVLELLAGQYLAQARLAEQQTAKLDREMDQLDRSIDKVERDMAELSATSTVAAKRVDNLGDQARGAATSMTALDARIKATRLSVRELGLEFARTGDKVDGAAFSREKSLLARLESLKKTLQGITPDGSTVAKTASSSGAGMGRMSATNPYVLAAGATAIGAVGPALGAMVAGVIAGAIGTGGVAGGLLMATKDPKVLGVARGLGDAISAEFFHGGDAFVKPAIESMGILEQAFRDMHVPEAFAQMAPEVTVIADGIGQLGKNLMPGLNVAFSRMGPYADAAHDGMASLGTALGTFIDDVTASPGAVLGLRMTFQILSGTVVFLGKEIKFLSDAFAGLLLLAAKAGQSDIIKFLSLGASDKPSKELQEAFDAFNKTNEGAAGAANGVNLYTTAADSAAEATKILNDNLNYVYDNFLLLEGDEVAVQEAIDNLSDSLEKNGLVWDKDTKAGRENVTAMLAVANTATKTVRDMLEHRKSVDDVRAAYDQYRQELYDSAIQAGATADEAQALVDKWLALSNLENLIKTLTIEVYVRKGGSQTEAYEAGSDNPFLKGFAAGGTTPAYEPFKVGEHGEEWMFASQQHFIANKQQMAQQWNGSSGGSHMVIENHITLMDPLTGAVTRKMLITNAVDRNVDAASIRAAYP